MKAWPHTHIGIARDEHGVFLGTRFLNQSLPIEQLLVHYPEAKSAIIFPLEAGSRWELEPIKVAEWVEKGSEDASIPGGGGFHE